MYQSIWEKLTAKHNFNGLLTQSNMNSFRSLAVVCLFSRGTDSANFDFYQFPNYHCCCWSKTYLHCSHISLHWLLDFSSELVAIPQEHSQSVCVSLACYSACNSRGSVIKTMDCHPFTHFNVPCCLVSLNNNWNLLSWWWDPLIKNSNKKTMQTWQTNMESENQTYQ